MSDPLHIGFVVEGKTDFFILQSVIESLCKNREIVFQQLHPEESAAMSPPARGGWTSVYKWCLSASSQASGVFSENTLFQIYDIVIIHVDADVAQKRYSDDATIRDAPKDLPCSEPCPPVNATTNRLRQVMLGWLRETSTPPKVVLCTPSKSLETWILVALYPTNRVACSPDVECYASPESQLGQTSPPRDRLVRDRKKQPDKYQERAPNVAKQWGHVCAICKEADRFSGDFLSAIPV